MFGEGSLGRPLGADELLVLVDEDGVAGAVRDLADPQTAVADLVVGQPWRTLVPVGLPVLTFPEDSAVLGISECSVQSGTVGSGDGGLQLRPLPALHQVQLGALLQGEGGVGVQEAQAVPAESLLGQAVLAVPVLVTAETIRTLRDFSNTSTSTFNTNSTSTNHHGAMRETLLFPHV